MRLRPEGRGGSGSASGARRVRNQPRAAEPKVAGRRRPSSSRVEREASPSRALRDESAPRQCGRRGRQHARGISRSSDGVECRPLNEMTLQPLRDHVFGSYHSGGLLVCGVQLDLQAEHGAGDSKSAAGTGGALPMARGGGRRRGPGPHLRVNFSLRLLAGPRMLPTAATAAGSLAARRRPARPARRDSGRHQLMESDWGTPMLPPRDVQSLVTAHGASQPNSLRTPSDPSDRGGVAENLKD